MNTQEWISRKVSKLLPHPKAAALLENPAVAELAVAKTPGAKKCLKPLKLALKTRFQS